MKHSLRILLPILLFNLSLFLCVSNSYAGNDTNCDVCNNVTYGGKIQGNETGCGNPGWDPSIITNLEFPTGGSGMMEYMWLFTTDDPTKPFAQWTPIPNSNTVDYDPGVIYKTTYYTRCSRRMGCTEFPGESNIVTKTFNCCNNITSAGKIGSNQNGCFPSYDPYTLTNITLPTGGSGNLMFQWYKSTQNIPFDVNNTAWVLIPGAIDSIYDPTSITTNTYYVRTAKRTGCTDFYPSNIVSVILFTPPTIMASSTPVKCYGESNGSINLLILGGKSPFTFNWNPNTIGNQQNPINLPAGNYVVTVTDGNVCSATKSINVGQPQQLSITFSNTVHNTCYGGLSGSVTANVSGGTVQYSYLWSNGATSNNLTNLASGTYSLTVTDKNGCTATNSVNITSPPSITISINKTDNKCNGDLKGQATAIAFGGVLPFTYLWSTGATSNSINNLAAGDYSITVTDNNGCKKSTNFSILQPSELSISFSKVDVKCFGGNSGSISTNVSNGTAPYTYLWSNGATSSSIQNLTKGNYSVTVTDNNGCKKNASISISEPSNLVLTTSKTDVKCNGDNSGLANVSASGGNIPYSYLWSNGITTSTNSNLTVGNYSVTVTDNNGCSKIASVIISSPSLITLTHSKSDVKCYGGNDGSATVTVTGGTGNYTYIWSNGATTSSINNLAQGDYQVTVIDENNCKKSLTITINQPNELTISSSKTDVKCFGANNGSASIIVTGGTPNYSYLWNNGATTSSITSLLAGTYTVTVTDNNGCKKTSSIIINQPTELSITLSKTDVNCFGDNSGSASVLVSGGTSNYSYKWSNNSTSNTINNLVVGIYSITVTDDNGCKKSSSIEVNQPTELIINSSKVDVKCFDGNDGSASISVTGGASNYSFLWSNGASSSSIDNLTSGTYSVTVTDANGCKKSNTVTINQPSELHISVTFEDIKCNGSNDGSASVSAAGGKPNYSILWSNGQTSATINNLTAGNYSVTVTDGNGCKKSTSITINQSSELNINISKTNVSCYNGNNGSAFVQVSGGKPNYTYIWSNGSTTSSINNLHSGTYSLTVTDNNGCKKQASIEITQPTELLVTYNKNDVKCYNGNDGNISLTTSGGTPNYNFIWSNGNTSSSIDNLVSGNYSVTVSDANNCTKNLTITINQPVELKLNLSKFDVKCYNGNDGSASVSVSGGIQNYSYLWSNGNTTNSINNLIAGDYIVTVTDANGCSKFSSIKINQPIELNLETTKSDVNCHGGNDGNAKVIASGGTPNYSYLWSNGATTDVINNLSTGNYSVTVTDANGCKKVISVTIGQSSELVLTTSTIDVLCNGGNTGIASVAVAGGTPNYSFLWSNGSTSSSINNLSAGNYSVTVSDYKGCFKSTSVQINEPSKLVSVINKSDVKCFSCSCGSANVSVTGGVAPYTFVWSNGKQIALNEKIKAGKYFVTITDFNGCKIVDSVVINQPTPLELEISKTDVKCFGANDGSASIVAKGGTPPYTFNWSNGQNSTTINNLAPGLYEVTVIDANKCANYESIEIIEPTELVASISKQDPKCNGENTGVLTANVSGGTLPYSYLWSNGAITSSISNLAPGTYSLTIQDNNGCKKVISATINEAVKLKVNIGKSDIACYNGNNGTVTVDVFGGTSPYSYLWNNGNTSSSISNLTAATYTVTVTDNNGCTKVESVTLTQPNDISIEFNTINIKCNGQNSGSISANVTGGNPTYNYLWSNGSTSNSISNLVAGQYSLTITDKNGCKKSQTTVVNEPTLIDATITKTDLHCNGGNDGSASVSVTGGTAPYSYSWSNGATSSTITNLKSGKYSVIVTDFNGCIVKKEIELTDPLPILVSISKTQLKCSNSSDGSATAFATGGKSPYQFKWSNGATSDVINNLSSGVYTVTVTDSNGCTASSYITIGAPNPIAINLEKVNISCFGSNDGKVTSIISGGNSPYELKWNTGSTATQLTNLSQGIYTLTVTDANKCVASASTTILEPSELNISVNKKDPLCNNSGDGEIKVTVTGGTPQYTYKWSNGGTDQTIKNLTAGTYTVTVYDANKCHKLVNITLANPSVIEANLSIINPKCYGQKGSASLTVTGGTPNYTYLWSNGETSHSNNNLNNGAFTVTITDKNGCSIVKSGEIVSPSIVVCSASSILKANCTDISTFNGNDGAAKVTASGGTGTFTYHWSNGSTSSTISNLVAGTYTVTVTDINGCSCVSSVTLKNPARLGDFVWVDNNRNGIQDPNEMGKSGVLVTLTGTDIKGNKITKTVYTDSLGKYLFDGLFDGDYKVTFALPTGYKFTKANTVSNQDIDSDADINTGMTSIISIKQGDDIKNVDAGLVKTINIGNYVWIDSNLDGLQDTTESGINNIKVKLLTAGPDGVFSTSDDIMVDMQNTQNFNGKPGYYLFTNVELGTYCLMFSNLPADYKFTLKNQGTNDGIDSDVDTNGMVKFTVVAGQSDDLTFDAGIHLKCNNTIFGGTVGVDQVLCGVGQTAATITNIQLPTGGSGNLEYLWLKSTVGPNYVPGDPNWIPIPNSNSENYSPGVLNQTTYFVRCSRRAPCQDYPAESNIITIKVEPIPVADFENFPTGDICVGKKYSISAVDAGIGSSYDWTINGAIPNIANTRVVNDVTWNTIGTYNVKLKVTKNTCIKEKSINVNVASCLNGNIVFGKLNLKKENNIVNLDWSTITPNAENFLFEIEHSDNGRSYNSIGYVNPSNTNEYTFSHKNPTVGTNYYRIKHIAANKKIVFSNVSNTMIKYDNYVNFVSYPNPTNGIVSIKPIFDVKQSFTVQVVNSLGQVLQTREYEPGTTYFEIDLSDNSEGLYLLYFTFDKFKHHNEWIMKNKE